jgi:adenylate cyclase
MPRWRRWLPWSAAGGLLAAVVALSEVGFALEEGYGLRTLFRLRGAVPPPPDVVVLRLDNDSLSVLRALPDAVGEWPAPLRGCAERHPALVGEVLQIAGIDRLPRRLQACVIELAHAAGAETIVYDIAFPASPDREAGTAELAAAIAAHGRVVLREATRREHLPGRTQLDIVTSQHPSLAAVAAGIATAREPDTFESVMTTADGVRMSGAEL